MDFILESEKSPTWPVQERAEADLAHFLPRLGPMLAVLLVVYSIWDLSLDPAHALQSGVTRTVFAVLAAFAFWPIIPNWSASLQNCCPMLASTSYANPLP